MPRLILELDNLVSPLAMGNYLMQNDVMTAVQTHERGLGNNTFQFNISEIYRRLIDYVHSCLCRIGECKCNNCCNYDNCESKRNIEDCEINITRGI